MSKLHKFSLLWEIDNDSFELDIKTVKGFPYQYKGIKYFIHQLKNKTWQACEYTTGMQFFPNENELIKMETKEDIRKHTKIFIDGYKNKINKSITNVHILIENNKKHPLLYYLKKNLKE